MKPDQRFVDLPHSFWANVRLISQKFGYTNRRTRQIKVPEFDDLQESLGYYGLSFEHLLDSRGRKTETADLLLDYFHHRAEVLNCKVEPNLMDAAEAKKVFNELRKKLNPSLPIRMNLQKGDKRQPSYLTNIVNFLVEKGVGKIGFDSDPHSLTVITKNNQPLRTLARRLDGAFPRVINPVAVWEIKEYYHTTTFGSRIADGVYETLLDGMELAELRKNEAIQVYHYLIVDAHYTWWDGGGRPYLCRIVDMLHMGLVDEVLFGREVIKRLPVLVREWVKEAKTRKLRDKKS